MTGDELLVKLVEALDRDLELLGTLRYRLIVLGALAGADQSSLLPTAVHEIEGAYEALRVADLVRASVTERLALEFDLEAVPRLDELAARTPGAWSEILLDRRRDMVMTITGIQRDAEVIKAAMGRRVALAEEVLSFLRREGASTYSHVANRGGLLVQGTI